ncbi:MAG TPA: hypothetical protein VK815_16615 [Candidatus Acidoferrales bacterium]|jgi:hypothetical protein|nr:hypothetical protein [Candidatus Acidoferrales bacterium]
MRRKLQILVLLPLLTGGCMTHKLWTENTLDNWNEPATPANLRVFNAEARKDFLVVYDEHSERHSSIHTRAYFLNENLGRLAEKRAPHFVSAGLAANFAALPFGHEFMPGGSNTPAGPFVVISVTNTDSFTLFFKNGESGEYQLPIYSDGIGNYERVALTPMTVAVDATIVGGVAGCLWLYCEAPGWGGVGR